LSKLLSNCLQNGVTSVCGTSKTIKERVIVLILHELRASVTYFLLGLYSSPPTFSYC